MSVQQDVIKQISEAAKQLLAAHQLAVKTNAMSESLPVFQKLLKLQRELGDVMQEVSKIRGL